MVQCSRKCRRCHHTTPFGAMIPSAFLQLVHNLDGTIQNRRSVRRSFCPFAIRLYIRRQLLAHGDVLEGQLTVTAGEEGAEAE